MRETRNGHPQTDRGQGDADLGAPGHVPRHLSAGHAPPCHNTGSGQVAFGRYVLDIGRRTLTREGRPVRLGGRATNLLIALVASAGEVVSKETLLSRVWPDCEVAEASLRAQVAVLRRALGEGQGARRYIVSLQSRGYCFVAPLMDAGRAIVPVRPPDPPPSPARIFGRDDFVNRVGRKLVARGFVTIVGAGGLGKTTVALAIARFVRAERGHEICFVNLASVQDPTDVGPAVAYSLGLVDQGEPVIASIEAHLRDRRMLLLLDNCEHVVAASAEVAEAVRTSAPEVLVLATSREPLRAAGEWVDRLPALAYPEGDGEVSYVEAAASPAVELFADRLVGHGHPEPSGEEVVAAALLCRRLEGIPLAIEIAAAQVETLGLAETISALSEHLLRFARGRGTSCSRHRTLRATLDWSFGLLDEPQRALLDRLAVFAGTFDLDAAWSVAGRGVAREAFVDRFCDLVAKSLVNADLRQGKARYSLSETTRRYGLDRLAAAGLTKRARDDHADWCRAMLAECAAAWETQAPTDWTQAYAPRLDDIRNAVCWCADDGGRPELALSIVIAAGFLYAQLGRLSQYCEMAEAAVARVRD